MSERYLIMNDITRYLLNLSEEENDGLYALKETVEELHQIFTIANNEESMVTRLSLFLERKWLAKNKAQELRKQ
jgi:hypothetical protein